VVQAVANLQRRQKRAIGGFGQVQQ
jgi:hypothetical protein